MHMNHMHMKDDPLKWDSAYGKTLWHRRLKYRSCNSKDEIWSPNLHNLSQQLSSCDMCKIGTWLTNYFPLSDMCFSFDSHILGMGRLIDLKWKRCELDIVLDAHRLAWQIHWARNGSMWNCYSFQPVGQWMGCPLTDQGAEGCCRSLNALFYFDNYTYHKQMISVI